MSRPSSYSPELAEQICALIAEGHSLRTIAKMEDYPSVSTIMLWALKDEQGDETYKGFSEQYARAMALRTDYHGEEMLEIADNKGTDIKRDANGNIMFDEDGEPIIDHDNIQRAKLQIETRKWLMGKHKPKKYGDKMAMVGGDKDDNPIAVANIAPEQIPAWHHFLTEYAKPKGK